MSVIQTQIINDMHNTTSDMATIIGRYKGSMGVFAEEARAIMNLPIVDPYTKKKLEWLASAMDSCIKNNEELWANRGKRDTTDIVQLERA